MRRTTITRCNYVYKTICVVSNVCSSSLLLGFVRMRYGHSVTSWDVSLFVVEKIPVGKKTVIIDLYENVFFVTVCIPRVRNGSRAKRPRAIVCFTFNCIVRPLLKQPPLLDGAFSISFQSQLVEVTVDKNT